MAPSSNLFCPATRVSALATTSSAPLAEWLSRGSSQSKEPGKQRFCHFLSVHKPAIRQRTSLPLFGRLRWRRILVLRDVLSAGTMGFVSFWCVIKNSWTLWPSKGGWCIFQCFLGLPEGIGCMFWLRRTMTSLPAKAAGTECFCTFAWKGPNKKHKGKLTQLQCTLFHFTLHDRYTQYTLPYSFTTFVSLTERVWFESAAGVGLSYLKLHLSIVNLCCGHRPLSIVDALDTTGRQFLRMSTPICRERFPPAPSQGCCECEHATHLKSASTVLGHGELLANFLERIANRLEQGCELPFSSSNRPRKPRKLWPFQMQFPKTMVTQNHLWFCDGNMMKKTMHLVTNLLVTSGIPFGLLRDPRGCAAPPRLPVRRDGQLPHRHRHQSWSFPIRSNQKDCWFESYMAPWTASKNDVQKIAGTIKKRSKTNITQFFFPAKLVFWRVSRIHPSTSEIQNHNGHIMVQYTLPCEWVSIIESQHASCDCLPRHSIVDHLDLLLSWA